MNKFSLSDKIRSESDTKILVVSDWKLSVFPDGEILLIGPDSKIGHISDDSELIVTRFLNEKEECCDIPPIILEEINKVISKTKRINHSPFVIFK